MVQVTATTHISTITVNTDAVYAKFANTPLKGYEEVFIELSSLYRIDPNWALSYLQWESGFAKSAIGLANPTNPWDILCYPGQWSAVGEYRVWNEAEGKEYCYAKYGSIRIGLEAGFRLWNNYLERGYNTWHQSLSIVLCGNPAGCASQWVHNVISQGNSNAEQWPSDSQSSLPVAREGLPSLNGTLSDRTLVVGGFLALLVAGIVAFSRD